jgi:hypothetical protein
MKQRLGSLFQTNAHSLPRRLYFALLRRLFAVFSKRQSVHFVRINGQRYKRVVFGDSLEAVTIERELTGVYGLHRFPALIHRHENELLVGYINGRRFDPAKSEDRAGLAAFYGELYRQGAECCDPEPFDTRLTIDLDFLLAAGVLESGVASSLRAQADRLRPDRLSFGLEYTDPVAKNFVIAADQRLYAIDVEGLKSGVALGSGVAKARIHWLKDDWQAEFVAEVERVSGVSLGPQLPYVELGYRVGWIKRKLLQGKLRRVQLDLLESLEHH